MEMKQRKFKLIKRYPNLDKKIQEGFEVKENKDSHYFSYEGIISNVMGVKFNKDEIEEWPEYWQEIIEQPILITEDGKELFEGDEYWYIRHHLSPVEYFEANKSCVDDFRKHIDQENSLVFSTQELAEKWIEENRPKWSDKDTFEFGFHCSKKSGVFILETVFNEWKMMKSK